MKNVDADLVILGNSRAEGGYDDALMTSLSGMKCLNLGWCGYPFDFDYHVMYNTYLSQNKKPRYIIVDAGPWAFFDHVSSVYSIEMLPYINRPEFKFYVEMCPQLSKADRFLFVRYFGKLGKVIKELYSFEHPNTNPIKEKRWSKDYFGKPQKLECNRKIVYLFHDFLDECLAEDIEVIVVVSPMHIEDGSSYFDMDDFWTILKSCAAGTGFKIASYLDYFGNDTIYFSDPAHLNDHGRNVFSAKLIHDLDSVGIIQCNILSE